MSIRDLIVRKKRNQYFPMEGGRRSMVWVNDPTAEGNQRRLRVDPLIDGWDPKENPIREGRIRRRDSKFPIR